MGLFTPIVPLLLAAALAPGTVVTAGSLAVGEPLSARTVVAGILVDRDEARLIAHAVKPRPFVDARRGRAADDVRRLELRHVGVDGQTIVRRIPLDGFCLDHDPSAAPHIVGDTTLVHRDVVLVELPELAGDDRWEISLRQPGPLGAETRSLGHVLLDEARDPQPIDRTRPTVLWPEDVGQTERFRTWGDSAEGDRRLNIVIVPDGYTVDEQALMLEHAETLVGGLRRTSPLAEHDRLINYTLVVAYSLQSGTDQCDCGEVVDTAFGTHFVEQDQGCRAPANRCLTFGPACDESGYENIVAAELRAPHRDETILMVNTARYGGCSGTRAAYSAGSPLGVELAAHELGHVVASLADEYVSGEGCGVLSNEINVSTDPIVGAWPEWIDDLGAPREGAGYWSRCLFRPHDRCKMRSLLQPFCPVCTQRWGLVLFGHPRVAPTAPIAAAFAQPETAVVGSTRRFGVRTRMAHGPSVENHVRWLVTRPGAEPVLLARDVERVELRFDRTGEWFVRCEVVADANLIKPAAAGANVDQVEWRVEVRERSSSSHD